MTIDTCTHRTRHQHGTDAAYKVGCCRCRRCTDASTIASKRAKYARTHGRPGIVPAEPVRAHMRQLIQLGMTPAGIATAAGFRPSFGWALMDEGRAVVRRSTAEAVLAVKPQPRYAPAVGVERRVRALMALGWSLGDVARMSGVPRKTLQDATNGNRARVYPATHAAVTAAHLQWWDKPGPDTWQGRRNRATAAARGWHPSAAWDDFDDPAEQPKGVSTSTPARGEQVAELVEDLLDMAASGRSWHEAVRRVGSSGSAVVRRLRRHGLWEAVRDAYGVTEYDAQAAA